MQKHINHIMDAKKDLMISHLKNYIHDKINTYVYGDSCVIFKKKTLWSLNALQVSNIKYF